MTTYTKLALTEAEFKDLHGAVRVARAAVAMKADDAAAAHPREYYQGRVATYDALLARFDAVLLADTSQDAEEDEEEDDAA